QTDVTARRARMQRHCAARSGLDEILPAAQPALEMRLRGSGVVAQQLIGCVARLLDQRNVALEIGEAQQRDARLPRAQEFTRPANQQILPRNLEAVAVLVDDLETLLGGLGERLLEQQHARAFRGAASDAPAE